MKSILICFLSINLFAGYNKLKTVFDMHFVSPEILKTITGNLPNGVFEFSEDGKFIKALGGDFETVIPGRPDFKSILQRPYRVNRKNISISTQQWNLEQETKKSLIFVKNNRAGVGYSFTIGTGFYISPEIIITNAHVYKDSYNDDVLYSEQEYNKAIYFSKVNGQGSGRGHLKLFCSDMDYCLIHAPRLGRDNSFLEFQMHPEKGSDVDVSLIGYPGVMLAHFFRRFPNNTYQALISSTGKGLFNLSELHQDLEFGDGAADIFDNWGSSKFPVKTTYLEKLLLYYTPSSGGTSGAPVINNNGKVVALNFFGNNMSTGLDIPTTGYTIGVESTHVLYDIRSKCEKKWFLTKHKFSSKKDALIHKSLGENFCSFINQKYF